MAKAITGSNIRSKAMQHEIHLQKTMLIVETGSEFSKPESNFVHKRGIISTKIYGIIENKFSIKRFVPAPIADYYGGEHNV